VPTETFRFPGHAGHDLDARLDLPEGPHLATALFAHCFTCGKDIAAARRIARRLAAIGIAVLRFDFTGLGQSGGDFAETGFVSNVADLVAAAEALTARGMAPGLIIGHSLGGAAVLRAAPRIASVRATVTIGAPFDPAHVTHSFAEAIPRIRAEGSAEVTLAGRPIRIGRSLVEDLTTQDPVADIARLGSALLVMHAPRDAIVGIENASRIFLAARHPKSFITLDDADHLISRAEDADYAAEVIAAWSARYLGIRPAALPKGAPEGIVRVTEAAAPGLAQTIAAGPAHHILADEPIAKGGTNRGMPPFDLLASALGACTSMTLRLYAQRKGLALTRIEVDVTHEKDMSATDGRPDHFHRTIRLEGELSDDQRARLHEIADKCPVHRTLEAGSRISTELAARTLA
jgi:putative redox protein